MSQSGESSPGVKLRDGWYDQLIESFGYERDGGEDSILWEMPMYISEPGGQSGKQLDEELDDFKRSRQPIARATLADQTFLKCTSQGRVFVVRLLGSGDLREASVRDMTRWWPGRWAVTNGLERDDGRLEEVDTGLLVTNIRKYSTALFYEKSSGILAGPEHVTNGSHRYVWMGDVSKSRARDAVISHIPPEVRQHAYNATAFLG